MESLDRQEIIRRILEDVEHEISDQAMLRLLVDTTVTENLQDEKLTFGQRAADALARGAGSWAFVLSFIAFLVFWISLNILLAGRAFDTFPFILLNLLLSCLAAIQAPLIMMSQNRQEEKDRARALNDYKVNLKTELMIRDIYEKLDLLLARQEESDSNRP